MSELTLPTIGYGAANVGNLFRALTDDEAWEILQTAWDVGVRYFDTAPHYGLGLSERRLGAFLATKPRDQFVVSTKVGRLLEDNPEGADHLDTENDFAVPASLKRVWDFSADGIRASVEESLERTGLDRFDVLYLHDPERNNLREGLDVAIPALASFRDQGMTRAIGVGSMDTDALLASANTGALDLLMVAGRYTLAEQPALAGVVPACREHGVGIVNASVFNSGLLATDSPGADARYEYGGVPAGVLEKVQAIAAVCREFGVSLPAAALQYTLRDDTVASIVVGGSKPDQLRQNAARMAESIPVELWRTLTEKGLIPA
ncbi:aldo/keto reductase [Mycetocola manganoxydans]|uniref:Aldo/keto reductase n=1 Tax=Mycetocola manganoxydans TaxID=699879 RepID=A0A3L6ZZ87_9MICO|nr:aldo/keto reductase [Mycetocola manganoxydans]RLP73030.1 aldo/keto reductase [Mycetocola manganoxydans]GHD44450.1 oxidoreductase [Mycetocola manganoxydans]